jgi:hypothetical protein
MLAIANDAAIIPFAVICGQVKMVFNPHNICLPSLYILRRSNQPKSIPIQGSPWSNSQSATMFATLRNTYTID